MNKIKTIFDRDWGGSRKVVNKPLIDLSILKDAVATEKLNGTNVRVTVRNRIAVRVEKRKNPTKEQKAAGIEEPWYIDANINDPQDKWIFDGLSNTNLELPDGEWSGELVGPNIQGNPLELEKNIIVFFSLGQAPVFNDVPINYEGLKNWLPKQKSKYGDDCHIEGIVWHLSNGDMYKIKVKDF